MLRVLDLLGKLKRELLEIVTISVQLPDVMKPTYDYPEIQQVRSVLRAMLRLTVACYEEGDS